MAGQRQKRKKRTYMYPYFARYNALPCTMHARVFVHITHGIIMPIIIHVACGHVYPCIMNILNFPSKIWAKKCAYYTRQNTVLSVAEVSLLLT